MKSFEREAEEICNDYWAEWKECIKYTDKLQDKIVVALAKAYQDGEVAGIERSEKEIIKKRETDKYPKCCMRAMSDNTISNAHAIRQLKPSGEVK